MALSSKSPRSKQSTRKMSGCPFHDAFSDHRAKGDAVPITFDGEDLTMIVGFQAVRKAARSHGEFSSDAPFRVPIPSEEDVRSVRQLPIEMDPPEHKGYRALIEPHFRRPLAPEYGERIEALLSELIDEAVERDSIEIVRDLALPLQSRALTYLFDVDESEAEEWISWGIHVFRDGEDGAAKGSVLEDYIHQKFDEAEQTPGASDFFSTLAHAEIDGTRLTREQCVGFANLAFAGGRDTVIQTVSSVFYLLTEKPDLMAKIQENPDLIPTTTEEFFRMVTPLTHIGRVNTEDRDVHGVSTPKDRRISLCWASANFDESVFKEPLEFQEDRKPNPHIAFGSGAHTCAGSHHARLIVRTLLRLLSERGISAQLLEKIDNVESHEYFERRTGFEKLVLKLEEGSV